MLRLRPIGAGLRRALSSESGAPRHATAAAAHRRMLLPRKKAKPLRQGISHDNSHRICAHMMGSTHTADELAAILRSRFGAGAVTVFGRSYDYMDEADDTRDIEDVVHLTAPACGKDAKHGSTSASIFFFSSAEGSPSVSIWWGADPIFEDGLLSDLRASRSQIPGTKEEVLDRLAVPKVMLKWHAGE